MPGEMNPLSQRKLDELLEVAEGHKLTTEFVVRTLARTGMRASELAHMRAAWVTPNPDEPESIGVPAHDPCALGGDGGPCPDCRSKAKQIAERRVADEDIDTGPLEEELADVLKRYWRPKSDSGERVIPVSQKDEYDRFRRVLRQFFDRNGRVGLRRESIWYHVTKLNDELSFEQRVTPHTLRHTFGTLAAANGANQSYIQDVMGHANMESSNRYIKLSGRQVKVEHDKVW